MGKDGKVDQDWLQGTKEKQSQDDTKVLDLSHSARGTGAWGHQQAREGPGNNENQELCLATLSMRYQSISKQITLIGHSAPF